MAASGYEDVSWLDVAMDDALGVRSIQRIGDLDTERQQGFEFHRAPGDVMLQRLPVEKLHGDERFSVLFADVVDSAYVGMIQRGCGFFFSFSTSSRPASAGCRCCGGSV